MPTFAECVTTYIASHEVGWRGKRTSQNWSSTLRDHAYPVLGRLPVDEMATEHVLAVLEPLWRSKPGIDPSLDDTHQTKAPRWAGLCTESISIG
jgi:hypothetical protein